MKYYKRFRRIILQFIKMSTNKSELFNHTWNFRIVFIKVFQDNFMVLGLIHVL